MGFWSLLPVVEVEVVLVVSVGEEAGGVAAAFVVTTPG